MTALRQFPVLVVLMLVGAGLMLVPAAHAAHVKNWDVSRTFLYHAVFFAILATILGIATSNWTPRHPARYHLMTLLVTYMVLPWMLGAPLVPLVPGLTPTGAYFEMVSALTTTGATLFDRPRILPESLHLWRALVGWAGGCWCWSAPWRSWRPSISAASRSGKRVSAPGAAPSARWRRRPAASSAIPA